MKTNALLHFVFAIGVIFFLLPFMIIKLPQQAVVYIWTASAGYLLLLVWAWLFFFYGKRNIFVTMEAIFGCLITAVTTPGLIRVLMRVVEHKSENEASYFDSYLSIVLHFITLSILMAPLFSGWWQKRRKW